MESACSKYRNRSLQPNALLNSLLLLLLSCFTLDGVNAQSDEASLDRVPGIIQTSDGTPVANAEVWLVGGSWSEPKVLAKTTSNSDGQFEFDTKEYLDLLKQFLWSNSVLALHETHGLGWFRLQNPIGVRDNSLKLQPTAEFHGRLVDASDQPIANATMYPTAFSDGTALRIGFTPVPIPKDLFTSWKSQTDSEGNFSIPNLPTAGTADIKLEHPTIETLTARLNLNAKATIKLDAMVACTGKIELPAEFDRSEIADQYIGTVRITRYFSPSQADAQVLYSSNQSAPIDSEFNFRFSNVPAGAYQVSVEFSESVGLLLPDRVAWEIGSETKPLVIRPLLTHRISGKVVARSDGATVAGVKMKISTVNDGRIRPIALPVSDAQGNYSAAVPAGKLMIGVAETPKEFVPTPKSYDQGLEEMPVQKVDVVGDLVLPDFKLDSAADVVLKVTDENGEPAAGAIVKVVTLAGYPDGGLGQPVQKTDASGQYTIRQVAVDDRLPIWVRTPTAISESLVMKPENQEGPVEIELSTEGVRFRAQVTDDDDEPIPNATISISTNYGYRTKWLQGVSVSGSAGGGKTDTTGEFVSGPLWEDGDYRLKISADGYSESETAWLRGKTGEVVDAGQVLLLPAGNLAVKGKVIDGEGAPIVGAKVFGAGREYEQAQTTTDASGQFTLDKVAADLKYVFVDHQDYRFTGAKASKSQELEIELRSKKDAPKGVRQWKPLNIERQHEGAHELIMQALDFSIGAESSSHIGFMRALDRIDPELANKILLRDEDEQSSRHIKIARVQRMEVSDTSEVIQILETLDKHWKFELARQICNRLCLSDDEADHKIADVYLGFADEVAGNAARRQIELALLYSKRGKLEKAESLIDEISKKIKDRKLTTRDYSPAKLAEAIAPIDFERAMKLTKTLKEGYKQTFAQAEVALAILKQDPEKSLSVIANLKGDSNAPNIRDKSRMRAALMLIDTDPNMAIDLVYQCEEPDSRSQALARLAVRVADFDRPKAWEMIDDAISVFRDPSAHQTWLNYGGAGPFAAALAYQAKLVEYPDMKSVVWNAIAACRDKSQEVQARTAATISTARMLALTDKIAARDLLRLVEKHHDQIPRDTYAVSLYDKFLQAWTLVDFGRATALIRADLERIEKDGAEKNFRDGQGAVFSLLVAPPEERFHLLFEGTGLWQLAEDGTERP